MESLELVRRAFDAYLRKDIEALVAIADPEVEVRSLLTEAERPFYHGHQGLRDWFDAVFDIFPDWNPRMVSAHELGDGAVLAAIDVTATSTGSKVPIHQSFWQSYRVRNGKVVWFGFHRTEADAREALGPGNLEPRI